MALSLRTQVHKVVQSIRADAASREGATALDEIEKPDSADETDSSPAETTKLDRKIDPHRASILKESAPFRAPIHMRRELEHIQDSGILTLSRVELDEINRIIVSSYLGGRHATNDQQRELARLRQEISQVRVVDPELEQALERLDASVLGTLTIRNWLIIHKHASERKNSYDPINSYNNLLAVGVKALEIASLKYRYELNIPPPHYFWKRIYGDMISYIRNTYHTRKLKGRSMLSLDAPGSFSNDGSSQTTLGDMLVDKADLSASQRLDAAGEAAVIKEIVAQLSEFFYMNVDQIYAVEMPRTERDKLIFLFSTGAQRLMSSDQIELFNKLRNGNDRVLMRELAEYFGVSESRVSQITAAMRNIIAEMIGYDQETKTVQPPAE